MSSSWKSPPAQRAGRTEEGEAIPSEQLERKLHDLEALFSATKSTATAGTRQRPQHYHSTTAAAHQDGDSQDSSSESLLVSSEESLLVEPSEDGTSNPWRTTNGGGDDTATSATPQTRNIQMDLLEAELSVQTRTSSTKKNSNRRKSVSSSSAKRRTGGTAHSLATPRATAPVIHNLGRMDLVDSSSKRSVHTPSQVLDSRLRQLEDAWSGRSHGSVGRRRQRSDTTKSRRAFEIIGSPDFLLSPTATETANVNNNNNHNNNNHKNRHGGKSKNHMMGESGRTRQGGKSRGSGLMQRLQIAGR